MEYEIIKQIPDKKKAGRKSIYKEITVHGHGVVRDTGRRRNLQRMWSLIHV